VLPIIEALLAAIGSIIIGGVAPVIEAIATALGAPSLKSKPSSQTYSARLRQLTSLLEKSSAEVDKILRELASVTSERAESIEKLESELARLENKEQSIRAHIATLERTPVAVAEHFAELLEPIERASRRRDFKLFVAGVVVTTIISIVIKFLLP